MAIAGSLGRQHAGSIPGRRQQIALADCTQGGEVRHYGRIGSDLASLDRAVRQIGGSTRSLIFTYEAGPCGYVIYRHLLAHGCACQVVAPSMTPRYPGERIKTDRRDCLKLACLARAGELIDRAVSALFG